MAVAIIGLFCSFVGNGQFTKDRLATLFDGVPVLLLQMRVKRLQALRTVFQHHEILTDEGADIRDLEGFVDEPAKGRLGIPVVKGDRQLVLWVSGHECREQVVR